MVTDEIRRKVAVQAQNRCGYCQSHQQYVPWRLEIEHITPISKGGTDNEENLWLACRACNSYKSDQTSAEDPLTGETVQLYNPRTQVWQQHFRWSEDGVLMIGITECGRATIVALNLNNLIAVTVRRNWVSAGWHPPL
ncbi:MAG: HNH endonuclease [Caldilineaceae bacterium]|nr:HNH endonuclease [Caldilineaceae bacterium]MCB0120786.1 HNH endonuclease [Caldilineaceae bacterium]